MAYATVIEFDVDLDTHLKIMEAAGDAPVKGLVVHTAGPCEGGINCIDVWESRDDADHYFGEVLMPALASLGIEGGPPVKFDEYDLPVLLRG